MKTFFALLLLSLAAPLTVHAAERGGTNGYFELRIYHANTNRIEPLVARFRDHMSGLFQKHGLQTIGFWTAQDQEKNDKLIYLLAAPNRDAFNASQKAFGEDPEFKEAYAATEKAHGPMYSTIDT